MTGNEAAEIVQDLCLKAGHAHSIGPGREPLVCNHCSTVINRLKSKHRDETPIPPAVLVHFAVDPDTGLVRASADEAEAIKLARQRNGLVVSMPVSSDWRETTGG